MVESRRFLEEKPPAKVLQAVRDHRITGLSPNEFVAANDSLDSALQSGGLPTS